MAYSILPAADADLDEQAAYLARESGVDLALRFYDAAARTFRAIARMPGIGEKRAAKEPRVDGLRVRRIAGFENHLAFYRSTEDGIEIVRVLHGARDIDNLIETTIR